MATKKGTINIAWEEDSECNSRITRLITLKHNPPNNFLNYFFILSNFIKLWLALYIIPKIFNTLERLCYEAEEQQILQKQIAPLLTHQVERPSRAPQEGSVILLPLWHQRVVGQRRAKMPFTGPDCPAMTFSTTPFGLIPSS